MRAFMLLLGPEGVVVEREGGPPPEEWSVALPLPADGSDGQPLVAVYGREPGTFVVGGAECAVYRLRCLQFEEVKADGQD